MSDEARSMIESSFSALAETTGLLSGLFPIRPVPPRSALLLADSPDSAVFISLFCDYAQLTVRFFQRSGFTTLPIVSMIIAFSRLHMFFVSSVFVRREKIDANAFRNVWNQNLAVWSRLSVAISDSDFTALMQPLDVAEELAYDIRKARDGYHEASPASSGLAALTRLKRTIRRLRSREATEVLLRSAILDLAAFRGAVDPLLDIVQGQTELAQKVTGNRVHVSTFATILDLFASGLELVRILKEMDRSVKRDGFEFDAGDSRQGRTGSRSLCRRSISPLSRRMPSWYASSDSDGTADTRMR